jgi:hypothetical protein
MLEGFDAIEDQQDALTAKMVNEEADFAEKRVGGRDGDVKPAEEFVDEGLRGGLAPLPGALAVEGPAEYGGFVNVAAEPFVDKSRLAGTSGGNDLKEVSAGISPCSFEEAELALAAD